MTFYPKQTPILKVLVNSQNNNTKHCYGFDFHLNIYLIYIAVQASSVQKRAIYLPYVLKIYNKNTFSIV